MIRNEAEFSNQLVTFWRSKHYFVQRVETGRVNRGVPDIYVSNSEVSYWVELKKVHTKAYSGMMIPWRPGQQGWMLEHYIVTKKPCITIVHCEDCILVIPMTKRYTRNIIKLHEIKVVHSISELIL